MLSTPMYLGAGLGNQLHNYVTVKCLAIDKGYGFGVQFPENFKGKDFMNLDMGIPVIGGRTDVEGEVPQKLPRKFKHYYREAMIDNGKYDPHIKKIQNWTLIHGNLQGEEYFKHRKNEIDQWLSVEPIDMPDNLCVINFRGGEYRYVNDFFLPISYWNKAIAIMIEKNPNMVFEVHTDDAATASLFFPNYKIIQNIGINWRSIRYAKYIILSNSSFAWLPAWLNPTPYIIAPEGWGRHNKGFWFLEQNYTPKFQYICG